MNLRQLWASSMCLAPESCQGCCPTAGVQGIHEVHIIVEDAEHVEGDRWTRGRLEEFGVRFSTPFRV